MIEGVECEPDALDIILNLKSTNNRLLSRIRTTSLAEAIFSLSMLTANEWVSPGTTLKRGSAHQ
jgi:hypothetical protein